MLLGVSYRFEMFLVFQILTKERQGVGDGDTNPQFINILLHFADPTRVFLIFLLAFIQPIAQPLPGIIELIERPNICA